MKVKKGKRVLWKGISYRAGDELPKDFTEAELSSKDKRAKLANKTKKKGD